MTTSLSRSSWIAAILVWAIVAAIYIHAGFQPDHGRPRLFDGIEPPYPIRAVSVLCVVSAIEIAMVCAMVRPWRSHRRWRRLLLTTVLMLAWSVYWVLIAMHQPPAQGAHLLWLLALDACLLIAMFADVAVCLFKRLYRWRAARRTAV